MKIIIEIENKNLKIKNIVIKLDKDSIKYLVDNSIINFNCTSSYITSSFKNFHNLLIHAHHEHIYNYYHDDNFQKISN